MHFILYIEFILLLMTHVGWSGANVYSPDNQYGKLEAKQLHFYCPNQASNTVIVKKKLWLFFFSF